MSQICVIVPVYKAEPYIHHCVDSILTQTFTDFELVLVDDGSPDNCPAICDEYAEKDKRVHVIHQPNSGVSAARNAALDWLYTHSESQWLAFIDSDDWVHPKYLESLLNGAQSTGMRVVIGGYANTYGEDPHVDEQKLTPVVWNAAEFFFEKDNINATVVWAKLFRRECFQSVRFPAGKICEDDSVIYKILFEDESVAVIRQPLYACFQSENSITRSPFKLERLDVFEALEDRIAWLQANEKYQKYVIVTVHRYLSTAAYMRDVNGRKIPPALLKQIKDQSLEKFRTYRHAFSLKKRLFHRLLLFAWWFPPERWLLHLVRIIQKKLSVLICKHKFSYEE